MSARFGGLWPGFILFLAAFVTYWSTHNLGWIWDDDQYIYANPLLLEWSGLFTIWFRPRESPQYYPAVFTTLWIEQKLFGSTPGGYHLINVVIHGINGVLCYLILRQLAIRAAFWIALAFILHPIQVESVAWVTEIKNLLSATFYGLSWLLLWPLLVRSTNASLSTPQLDGLPSRSFIKGLSSYPSFRLAASIGLFVLALLSKSVTASLPAALGLLLWFKQGRLSWKQVGLLAPLLLLGAAIGWNTARLERLHVGAVGADWEYGTLERIGIASRAILHYLQQAVVPLQQIFFYPRFDTQFDSSAALATLVVVLGIVFACVRAYAGRRDVFTGAAFFVGSAFPALGFLNDYPHRFSFVADHFVYIPIVGLLALVWSVLERGTNWLKDHNSWHGYWHLLPLVVISLFYAGLTIRYIPAFQSRITLWEDTLAKNPDSPAAMQNLGLAYVDANRLDDAQQVLSRALDYEFDRYQTLNSLGLVAGMRGDFQRAEKYFSDSFKLNPANPRPLVNLGNLLRSQSQGESAAEDRETLHRQSISAYQRAWKVKPNYLAAFALGTISAEEEQWREASLWFENAVDLRPRDLDARFNLAECYLRLQHFDSAFALAQALARDFPQDHDCRRLLRRAKVQHGL